MKYLINSLHFIIPIKIAVYNKFWCNTIHNKIIERLDHGCFDNSSHIVILEIGGIPSSNEGIYQLAEMYKKDFSLNFDEYLDIVADELIFWYLINIR